MAKRMLIDAAHPEETRVAIISGNRIEEFDFESSTKKQVKGNIYLAKITRVEPSLQAAFVDYGGNRHGFLAFSEIHPDYYRIPVGDREESAAEPVPHETEEPAPAAPETAETAEAAAVEEEEGGVPLAAALPEPVTVPQTASLGDEEAGTGEPFPADREPMLEAEAEGATAEPETSPPWEEAMASSEGGPDSADSAVPEGIAPIVIAADADAGAETLAAALESEAAPQAQSNGDSEEAGGEIVETLGEDELEEAERQRSRTYRHYKIQEVIKRRQIMLVQVTKEERGNKGAALTTYLSLAGRYCVLMPNTARGGGVSRKITSISDRRRLKDVLEDLDIPEGMGVIVRTAGSERSKAEIKRDYEYLLRLWNEIRDLTLRSTAPALIYEEGNLIKRSIRDLYTRDIDEVLVEGEEGYRTAKAFMKMLMPSHAKRVQPYRDAQVGLLHRFQVESQIDAIHSPIVQLRSGSYIVINQTEALVAIDVNSGRSTRERNIEETAVRTNLEAADEIARQLRLRDFAGLIVIDFIDMEERRNQGAVERRLKEALKNDRARIQVGRISPFGLLEMSRQRLRPSLVEASTQPCPHCGGTGFVRSTESTALYVLRSIEEEGIRRRSAEICVYVPTAVALYILNQKRDSLIRLEARYGLRATIARDDALIPPAFRLERVRALEPGEAPAVPPAPLSQMPAIEEEEEEEAEETAEAEAAETARQESEGKEDGRARRRRRRPRRTARRAPSEVAAEEEGERILADAAPSSAAEREGEGAAEDESEAERRRRRRGRRGGKRRSRREDGAEIPPAAADTIERVPLAEADQMSAGAAAAIEQPEEAMPWAAETGEIVIETASLPAFAGDALAPEPAAEGAALEPIPSPAAMPAAAEPEPTESPPTAESQEGVPFLSEAERHAEAEAEAPTVVIEPSAAPEPEQGPSPPVQTVSEPPANPRRGWWQRLIPS